MIIKLLGITLVMSSASLLGVGFSECMKSREKELRNLSDAIEMMINELEYTIEPVKFLFKKVLPMIKGEAYYLFEEISEEVENGTDLKDAWTNAVKKKSVSMSLSKSDCEILISNSDAFFAYELEQQKSQLKGLQSRIHILADNAAEFKTKNSKLVQMLGVYGGIFICAVLF